MGEGSNQMVLKMRPGVKKRLGLATIWNSGAGEVRGGVDIWVRSDWETHHLREAPPMNSPDL
jgi:hypothetical protein